jgi:hypothetical protein
LRSSPSVSRAAASERSTTSPALTISSAPRRCSTAAARAVSSEPPNWRAENDRDRWRATPLSSGSRQRAS